MIHHYSAGSLNQVWLKIAEDFRSGIGIDHPEGRNGPTKEILHACFSISNPRARWLTARTPAINPAFAYAELVWTVTGREDSAFLNFFNPRLPLYAGDGPTYHGAYGKRLRHHLGLDQLEQAVAALSSNPDSRQIVLQYWDSTVDFPHADGSPRSNDIPCNVMSLLKIRAGKLDWMQIMRSNDAYRGVPYDVAQFTFLQELIAGWVGVEPGSYCHISDSLHVYENDLAKLLRIRDDEVIPDLDAPLPPLPFKDSLSHFAELAHNIETIIDSTNGVDELIEIVDACKLPEAYQEMLVVLSAEGLRRRGQSCEAEHLINRLKNSPAAIRWIEWSQRNANATELTADIIN